MAPGANAIVDDKYACADDVLERYKQAAFVEDNNILVVMNRQQGRITILRRFIDWLLDHSGKTICFVDQNIAITKQALEGILLDRGSSRIIPMTLTILKHVSPDLDKFDLIVINEFYFYDSHVIAILTDGHHYVGMTWTNPDCEFRPSFEPDSLSETIDRRWDKTVA